MGTSTLTPANPLGPATTKAQALRSYDPDDFPALTGREEEWRFTPLDRLRVLLEGAGGAERRSRPAPDHGPLPDGVSITDVSREDPRIGSVLTPFDRLSALAFNGFDTATVLRVDPGTAPAEPVALRVLGGSADAATYAHTFIEIGTLADATLVIEQAGGGALADNVEVAVADGARLTLVTVAGWDPDAVQAQHVRFQLGRDASVVHVQVTVGGSLVRQYTSVEYTGPGGDCEAHGLYFAGSGQHLEHRLLVDHAVPSCRSHVTYRGALRGAHAHTVWVGDVLIRAAATGTDTYEINRNLVLSDGARADSVPNLEIETGEVVGAGHASTTGRFDDEQLFYLMSRGIPAEEARKLVVSGFFAELLVRVPVAALRQRLAEAIDARLAGEER
ncbi:MAG: Fe-S cluster assembly protein SufD [Dactylosporangium sp.]|nr:Fe-S cluster assembly protein SufD [Dactylosporangium sp.]NNJ62944.1 Fe-S cluster assembly protein SufD [Dactylosporangium sp.]